MWKAETTVADWWARMQRRPSVKGRDFRAHGRIRLDALQKSFARSLAAREGLTGSYEQQPGESGSAHRCVVLALAIAGVHHRND
jgi:hypothetical protein